MTHEERMYAAMAGEHRLRYVGTGKAVQGRCSCDLWVEFGSSHLGPKRRAIKAQHERHIENCDRATKVWA